MDQFSFHGPFAYRWIDDVPVERIDLRSGERRSIAVGSDGIPPVPPGDDPANPRPLSTPASPEVCPSQRVVRAAMAAWN